MDVCCGFAGAHNTGREARIPRHKAPAKGKDKQELTPTSTCLIPATAHAHAHAHTHVSSLPLLPTLRRQVALCGARFKASVNGTPVAWWSSFHVEAGQVLTIEGVELSTGVRGYLAVQGGIDVPPYLGSRATFPSGKLGGYQGRYLRPGDSLPVGAAPTGAGAGAKPTVLPAAAVPTAGSAAGWEVGVLPGPHADPDYVQAKYMVEGFYGSAWKVHYNSNRLGVRLVGPKPTWVRSDGGEGGSHPSNVHDHIYPIGAINFTGAQRQQRIMCCGSCGRNWQQQRDVA